MNKHIQGQLNAALILSRVTGKIYIVHNLPHNVFFTCQKFPRDLFFKGKNNIYYIHHSYPISTLESDASFFGACCPVKVSQLTDPKDKTNKTARLLLIDSDNVPYASVWLEEVRDKPVSKGNYLTAEVDWPDSYRELVQAAVSEEYTRSLRVALDNQLYAGGIIRNVNRAEGTVTGRVSRGRGNALYRAFVGQSGTVVGDNLFEIEEIE